MQRRPSLVVPHHFVLTALTYEGTQRVTRIISCRKVNGGLLLSFGANLLVCCNVPQDATDNINKFTSNLYSYSWILSKIAFMIVNSLILGLTNSVKPLQYDSQWLCYSFTEGLSSLINDVLTSQTDEAVDHVCIIHSSSYMKRTAPVVILLVDLRTVLHQELHNICMPRTGNLIHNAGTLCRTWITLITMI